MPTPRAGYFLKDGSKVPGTTTIIGRFKESGGLLQWAFKQGKEGKAHLYEEANKAADIGTCAHGMVELYIKGAGSMAVAEYALQTLPDPDMRAKAQSSFNAYLRWAENFDVKIEKQELQLVSEIFRYGGTLDAIGTIGAGRVVLDWKTSNAIYSDYLIQLAAYGNLWNENFPDQPITGGFHLLRFAKENSDFAHHYFANLDEEWKQFVAFTECYERDKIIKKRAA